MQNIFHKTWTVPDTMECFDGHFPGNPVLPAYAIVEVTLDLLRDVGKTKPPSLTGISKAKFISPIGPGDAVRIDFTLCEGEWKAVWKKNGKTAAELFISVV